jgi:plastocyanin
MERLDWKNCKNIEFIGDIKANYDFIIELEDMPFEKGQKIAFDSEGGITYGCIVDRVRGMKIFLIVEEEE